MWKTTLALAVLLLLTVQVFGDAIDDIVAGSSGGPLRIRSGADLSSITSDSYSIVASVQCNDGNLVVATSDGWVYKLERDTLDILWSDSGYGTVVGLAVQPARVIA